MRLIHLNRLALRVIEAHPGITKAECARILRVSGPTFAYRIKNGIFSWEDIKKLRLPLPKKEFMIAIEKDLKTKQ